MEKVRYEVADGVATVTIARPEVRNAMDLEVFQGLADAAGRADADEAVRAVVVTGEGQAFSSGIDVSIFAEGLASQRPIDIGSLQRSYTSFERCSKPVIAAIHGAAFGGGIQLALACDLRVAAADAELSVMETRWGIIPDLGAIHRLPRIIGIGRAKDMLLTGRRVPAEEALQLGLVNRVVPADQDVKEATEWARELAAGPPLALARIKRLVGAAFDVTIDAGLEREASAQRPVLASDDFREAVTARMEKREPRYRNT
ncbi:MAG TPA: enoyl-CoA hydratase-related protein [Actinomycetota bacterium]